MHDSKQNRRKMEFLLVKYRNSRLYKPVADQGKGNTDKGEAHKKYFLLLIEIWIFGKHD